MKLYTFYKVNIHGNRGYAFKNWLLSVQRWRGNYLIVMKIPFIDLKWTIYKNKVKPKFRNLTALTILFFPSAVFLTLLYLIAVPVVFIIDWTCALFLYVIQEPYNFDFREKLSAVIWFILGIVGILSIIF